MWHILRLRAGGKAECGKLDIGVKVRIEMGWTFGMPIKYDIEND